MITTIRDAIISQLDTDVANFTVQKEQGIMHPPCIGVYYIAPGQVQFDATGTGLYVARFALTFYVEAGDGPEGDDDLIAVIEAAMDSLRTTSDLGQTNVNHCAFEGYNAQAPYVEDTALTQTIPLAVSYIPS